MAQDMLIQHGDSPVQQQAAIEMDSSQQPPPTAAPPPASPETSASPPTNNGKDSEADGGQPFHDQQAGVLPHKKLMIVFPVLALAQFTAYLDQTSISAAVPVIGNHLSLGANLSWVANSYMLATTAVQLVQSYPFSFSFFQNMQ